MKTITANEFIVMWQYSQGMARAERTLFRHALWHHLELESRIVLRELSQAITIHELE